MMDTPHFDLPPPSLNSQKSQRPYFMDNVEPGVRMMIRSYNDPVAVVVVVVGGGGGGGGGG